MDTPTCFDPALGAQFRQRLARVEAELTQLLRITASHAPDTGDVLDFKTLAQEEALAKVDEAQAAQARARLHELQAARTRMAAGQYGICVECEEPIDLRRLETLPETPYCASCRQLHEQHARRPG